MSEEVPWERLFEAASKVRGNAWAPYSHFPVGAAVLTESGIYSGANVENSSYGLSVCAERNAIGRAVSEGARKVKAVAIVTNADAPCPPCGMCRQVITEFGEPGTPVRSRSPDGREAQYTLKELLPHAFTRDFL